MAKNKKKKKVEGSKVVCTGPDCPVHGNLKTRGRIFKGYVIKKFPKRIVIEFERIIPVAKYERYKKESTKMHARLPDCVKNDVKVGDYVAIRGCRPLSKLIHHVFIKKLSKEEK